MFKYFSISLVGFFIFVMEANANRVLLREVTSLTLHRGEYTAGRRSAPVPQLECIGGTAYGRFSPKTVQCYNRGWDGSDVQWECKAEMPLDYQFGKIEVTCEGYDYPNDPFILAGSCGLRYELDYTSTGAKKQAFTPSKYMERINFESIVYILFFLFVAYLIYLIISNNRSDNANANRGGADTGGWGPGPDGRRPPPPGWSPPPGPPPSYDDTFGTTHTAKPTTSTGGSGPGFYTGMGLGALGGYLFGRNRGDNYGYGYGSDYRYRGPTASRSYSDEYTGYDGSAPSTSSGSHFSSSTHSSSGFGGTSRR